MVAFDWTDTIKLDFLMLRLVGLWPNDRYKFDWYSLYIFVVVTFFITGHVIFHTVKVFMVGMNLKLLIGALYMSITEAILLLKICYFVKNSGKLKKLMADLNSETFQPKSSEHVRLVMPDLEGWQKVHRGYTILVCYTVCLFMLLPMLSRSTKEHRLPLDAWYPYDTKTSPNYEITYFYQVVSSLYRGVFSASMDTFTAALNTYVGTQCSLLCHDLRNLAPPDFHRELKSCIEHHKKIVSFARDSNDFFEGIVLGQFCSTSVALALAMFLMSLVKPFSTESNNLVLYLGTASTQLFLYCWFGNKVFIKSSQIQYSAFESDWTGVPEATKKSLLIFTMRAQRPIEMSVINMFPLSLATFTTILRTSWSYFAVLRQINVQD